MLSPYSQCLYQELHLLERIASEAAISVAQHKMSVVLNFDNGGIERTVGIAIGMKAAPTV